MTSSHSVKKRDCYWKIQECSIACRKVISDLKRPALAVGCARKTHLGKISRKRSEVVPMCDAQLPGVPGGPVPEIIIPVYLIMKPLATRPSR